MDIAFIAGIALFWGATALLVFGFEKLQHTTGDKP